MEIKAGKSIIKNSRIKKSRLFVEHQDFFMAWLIAEIEAEKNLAHQKGFDFSVRLNGTSDIDWANTFYQGKNIFEIFSDIQFYDYTKNHNKLKNVPANYDLTLSYTGKNWLYCELALKDGFNVAVVFDVAKNKPLPKEFKGYVVIDGDITDYRVNDAKGVIVGLRFKSIADKEAEKKVKESVFVVKEKELVYS
jgi:hypothetical protein